jgi:hypothetical protein
VRRCVAAASSTRRTLPTRRGGSRWPAALIEAIAV